MTAPIEHLNASERQAYDALILEGTGTATERALVAALQELARRRDADTTPTAQAAPPPAPTDEDRARGIRALLDEAIVHPAADLFAGARIISDLTAALEHLGNARPPADNLAEHRKTRIRDLEAAIAEVHDALDTIGPAGSEMIQTGRLEPLGHALEQLITTTAGGQA